MSREKEEGTNPRRSVYYWKCDRPAALHGVLRAPNPEEDERLRMRLAAYCEKIFHAPIRVSAAVGEGIHRTFRLDARGKAYFIRVENGPEADAHLEMETRVMAAVAEAGVPVPRTIFCDVSRSQVPFSVQILEYFAEPDLNRSFQEGTLALTSVAREIGRAVGMWQGVRVEGFGPFGKETGDGALIGFHASYAEYFHLRLEEHLHILRSGNFLTDTEAGMIRRGIAERGTLLDLVRGCLVHKDLALWNILGAEGRIAAFIDWEDAISGDPVDDLSLLACFHPTEVAQAAAQGYESVRPLPEDFVPRLWLHMLRNMIVKAVIRVGAGYFESGRRNFLVGAGRGGAAFRDFTRKKLLTALRGLLEDRPLSDLGMTYE